MKNVLKLGLIISGISILSSLIVNYFADLTYLFSFKNMAISILITGLVAVFLGRKLLRDPEEGRLGYGQAVKKLFIAFLITAFITTAFSIVMYGNDEDLKEGWFKYQIEMQEAGARLGARMAGQSEAEQEEAVEQIREMVESGEIKPQSYPFSWSQFPLGIVNSTVFYLLITLLLALFVREKETNHA